jgi:DNA repair photolyase
MHIVFEERHMALERPLFICDHAERLICPLPLKIDAYRGCSTRCAYCSLNGLRTGGISGSNNVQPNSIRYIEKFFYKRKTGMERALIDQRSPIQIGVSADPLQPAEKQFHVTLRVLKILQDKEYPCFVTTKCPTQLTEPRYLDAIEGLPLAVQCSVSTEDPAMLQRLEPGAPSLEERMAALDTLNEAGVHVQLRLWPYIPDLAGNLEILLGMAHVVGVKDVLCNFLKVYHAGGTSQKINEAVGRDYLKTTHLDYRNAGLFKIASYVDQIRELSYLRDICRTFGLNLLTCDDFIHTRNWGDCCGVGKYPGFTPSPWAYYVNGWRINEHTTFEEYISSYDCPWHDEFQAEWNKGKLARSVSGLRFNEQDKTYSRSW